MNQLTELVFILDRSGSMSGLEKDTIGGFNSLIEKQKKVEGEVIVSTVLFDDERDVIHNRIPIEQVHKMTDDEYYVRGCTALLDAIGYAIQHIGHLQKQMNKKLRPQKTLFIITTDGMENASREFSYRKVKKMITHQKEKYGWEFLFLGANIDAIAEASRFGIDASCATEYSCDEKGIELNYQVLNETIRCVRQHKTLDASWKEEIEKDYRQRKNK